MNSNLLDLVECPSKHRPLMMDGVPVSAEPEAGPFLVTSSKSLLWVDRAFQGGFLRLAVRQTSLDALFASLVEAIIEKGVECEWGNVLPTTKEGVLEGLAYLDYYGLSDPTLLYGDDFDIGIAPDLSRVPAPWLPPTRAVLIPTRSYVGTAYLFGDGHVGALVHNPSRGVVVFQ